MIMNRVLKSAAILLIAALLLAGCGTPPPTVPPTMTSSPGVTNIDPPLPIVEFNLLDQDGIETHLSTFQGKYTLIAFGYTHCPDVCPVTLGYFKQVRILLGEESEKLNFFFVSVDGARDVPARMKEYLSLFDPSFQGMSGEETQVRALIRSFGGDFNIRDAGGLRKDYLVEHTASSYLVNPEGQIIVKYAYGTAPELVVENIRARIKG